MLPEKSTRLRSADLQVGNCWPEGQRYAETRTLPQAESFWLFPNLMGGADIAFYVCAILPEAEEHGGADIKNDVCATRAAA